MSVDQFVTIFSVTISFVGLLLVVIQLRDGTRQRKLESQIHLYDLNRELISLGFANPRLFDILKDAADVEPTLEQRYLQLWLNLYSLVHAFGQSGAIQKGVEESFVTDFRDVLRMKNMRRHWQRFGQYYPASFQQAVNAALKEAGPSDKIATP